MGSYTYAMSKTKSGFTIVELLIVIVVIGILAAITVVAFNGVTTRAENTKTRTGAKEYIKALRMYGVENGAYPTVTACLGEGYDYNGEINKCGGNVNVFTNATFDSALQKYFNGSKPSLSTKNIVIYSGNTRAGGYFNPAGGSYGVVYYILSGATDSCMAGDAKSLSSDAGVTGFYCTHSLPAPSS